MRMNNIDQFGTAPAIIAYLGVAKADAAGNIIAAKSTWKISERAENILVYIKINPQNNFNINGSPRYYYKYRITSPDGRINCMFGYYAFNPETGMGGRLQTVSDYLNMSNIYSAIGIWKIDFYLYDRPTDRIGTFRPVILKFVKA